MAILMISYDLNRPGQDYPKLYEAIKMYPWAHAMQSTWFISTTATPLQVYTNLKPYVDSSDRIVVATVDAYTMEGWLSQEVIDWIKRYR